MTNTGSSYCCDSESRTLENKKHIFTKLTQTCASLNPQKDSPTIPEVLLVTKYASLADIFPLLINGMTITGENYLHNLEHRQFQYEALRNIFKSPNTYLRYCGLLEAAKLNPELVSINHICSVVHDIDLELLESGKLDSLAQFYLSEVEINREFYLTELKFLLFYAQKFLVTNELDIFGEKFPQIKTHLIGSLQSRKAKKAAEICDSIDSVDSVKLANKLNKYRLDLALQNKVSNRLQVMIQLRSPERSFDASGIDSHFLLDLADYIVNQCESLELTGLMFVASTENKESEYEFAYNQFKKLQKVYPDLDLKLSMGMTDSIEIAMKYHTNMLRIGSAFFK